MHLGAKELGALVKHFDTDESGTIDGKEFVIGFNAMSNKAKKKEKERIAREGERRKEVLYEVEKKFKEKFRKKTLRLPSLGDKEGKKRTTGKSTHTMENATQAGIGREIHHFDAESFLKPNSMRMSGSSYMDTSIDYNNFDECRDASLNTNANDDTNLRPLNGRVSTAQANKISSDISLGKLLKASCIEAYSQKQTRANINKKKKTAAAAPVAVAPAVAPTDEDESVAGKEEFGGEKEEVYGEEEEVREEEVTGIESTSIGIKCL